MKYLVIKQHISEYPEPITFSAGALIDIGEKYQGSEDWDNWYLCRVVVEHSAGQKAGWVPQQVIEWIDDNRGKAIEDYTARELNVNKGDTVLGSRELNGWLWCTQLSTKLSIPTSTQESGWIPIENLQLIESE